MVDEARAWRPALSGILRVPAGPRGADRARNPLADPAAYHPAASLRVAAPCRTAPGVVVAPRPVSLRPYRRPAPVAADALGGPFARRGRATPDSQPLHQGLRIFGLLRRRCEAGGSHRTRRGRPRR